MSRWIESNQCKERLKLSRFFEKGFVQELCCVVCTTVLNCRPSWNYVRTLRYKAVQVPTRFWQHYCRNRECVGQGSYCYWSACHCTVQDDILQWQEHYHWIHQAVNVHIATINKLHVLFSHFAYLLMSLANYSYTHWFWVCCHWAVLSKTVSLWFLFNMQWCKTGLQK